MQRSTFRTFTYVVGFLGIVFVTISNSSKLATTLLITLCIILMVFGFFVTSKWSKFLIGEEQTNQPSYGSMGG